MPSSRLHVELATPSPKFVLAIKQRLKMPFESHLTHSPAPPLVMRTSKAVSKLLEFGERLHAASSTPLDFLISFPNGIDSNSNPFFIAWIAKV